MATPAQRAARKRRRQAKAARNRGPQKQAAKKKQSAPKRGPIFRNPVRVPRTVSKGINPAANTLRGRMMGDVYSFPYKEECLGSFSTSVAFANTTYVLNAANSVTFPWMGSIAPKFEYYRFKKLGLKFVSTSADAVGSTNTALGSVLINTNYDVLDPAFASQIEMEAYGGGKMCSEACPDKSQFHAIEPLGLKGGVAGGWRYCLPSIATTAAGQPYPASSSAHDYDIGLLQIASSGVQAASVAGRIYLCYQVEFANPKLAAGAPVGGFTHWSATSGATATNLTNMQVQTGNTLSGITMAASTITFPAGQAGNYLVLMALQGSTSASAFAYSSATGGVSQMSPSLFTSVTRNALGQITSLAGTTTNAAVCVIAVTITGAGGTLVLSNSTIVGTLSGDVFIVSMPSTVLTVDEKEQLEIDMLQERNDALERRLLRLEGMLSPPVLLEDDEKSPDENKESSGSSLKRSVGRMFTRS